jgi:lipopolysaccharide biosynthesis glycosyltransferase
MSAPIHIALTFDDNFWAPAYAVMRSICLFTKRRGDLVFHLLHRPLSDEHRDDLRAIESEFGARLVWYDLDRSPLFADIAARMPENKRLSNIVYARLVIDQFVDPSITRILYLDCDLLIRAPIETLYETDLEGHPIAAVRDTLGPFIVGGRDLKNNRDLFDIADPYFNAGVLLIDLERWRQARLIDRLEAMFADGTMDRIYYDQDFLNLVFKHDWLRLAPTWNVIDARHAHEGLDLNIMHYTSAQKPWQLVSNVAFRRIYRHVMTNELFYRYLRHRLKRRLRRLVGRA